MLARLHRVPALAALWLVPLLSGGIQTTYADPVHGSWSQLTPDGTPPPGRSRSEGIYDPVGQRLVTYGGYNGVGEPLLDTWSLSLGGSPAWTDLVPSGTPPYGGYMHTAIYDAPRQRMLVFGGTDGFPFPCCVDMRALALTAPSAWSYLATAGTGPTSRWRHAAIYDPLRERMVVFGGHAFGQMPDNQVWELTLSGQPTWSQIVPAGTPPSGRSDPSAVYDPLRDRMLVFGGAAGGAFQNDVWELNLSGPPAWSLLVPTGTAPTERRGHAAVYDPLRDRMVVFSGLTAAGAHLDDVWELSLSGSPQWSQLSPLGMPPVRRAYAVGVYDTASDRMVVFSGQSDVEPIYLDDAWALYWGPTVEVSTERGPMKLRLGSPHPTPARDGVTFEFELPVAGRAVFEIFDLGGRLVGSVVDGVLPAGRHTAHWGRTTAGAGLYFARLRFGAEQRTCRLVLAD